MSVRSQNERIIFGLKVKQLRQERGLSFAELAEQTQMSISYLNEIEKGKKYPKEDKVTTLAGALGVKPGQLTSLDLERNLAPVNELLQSNFLNELPLDLFGIDLSKVVEIIANAPLKVGAFISTLLELSRNYALHEEHFYFGALRSFLELNHNYFQEIEDAVAAFCLEYDVPEERPLRTDWLGALLENRFRYKIVSGGLDRYPDLGDFRAIFLPDTRELLLNSRLSPLQKSFQYGKELAFQVMNKKERAYTSSLVRPRDFEEVLNHAQATYFSVALHMPLEPFVQEVRSFFAADRWDGDAFLAIMRKYEASPEMFFHRLTNVVPRFLHLPKLFFLRFIHDPERDTFEIDKELHLSRRHHPHASGLFEHYCRRWVSLSLLKDLRNMQKEGKFADTVVGAQRSKFVGVDDEYLCFTLARPAYPAPNRNVSVTLGLLLTPELKNSIRFWNDPSIPVREVNQTCERCSLSDCEERAAPASINEKREKSRRIQATLDQLIEQR